MNKSMRILVMDDFPTMRRIVRTMLRDLGYTNVHEAEDSMMGLAHLRASPFDFVITDWNMPNLNGLEMLKEIRADARLAHLPVLMVTAESKKENRPSAALPRPKPQRLQWPISCPRSTVRDARSTPIPALRPTTARERRDDIYFVRIRAEALPLFPASAACLRCTSLAYRLARHVREFKLFATRISALQIDRRIARTRRATDLV